MRQSTRSILLAALLVSALVPVLFAQVSNERLLRADDEAHNWLMYSGSGRVGRWRGPGFE